MRIYINIKLEINPYTVKGGGGKWPMTYFFAYNFWTVRD